MTPFSLELANKVVSVAREQADSLGVQVNIAVVDEAGFLKAFARMNDASLGTVDIAINKAHSAAIFRKSTHELGKIAQNRAYGVENLHGGIAAFPGGVLLHQKSELVGAIGVSGGLPEQDKEIAEAARNFLKNVE